MFLDKYFRENDFAITRHHIDSYEHCMFEEIPTIIRTANPIVFLKEPLDKEKTVFAYRVEIFIGSGSSGSSDSGSSGSSDAASSGLTISSPVVELDGGHTVRRMFPNEARLRNMTYAAQINADILIRVTFTRPKPDEAGAYLSEVKEGSLIRGFPLFRMPILLRSKLCPTSVPDPALLEEMGECRNDYGGYFIIEGSEKVLITRGEQAFNSLYVEKKASTDDAVASYASVVSLHPETKQTRRVAMYLTRAKFDLVKNRLRGGEIRVAVPMIRGAFPLFILFRALGLESDEEIVRMIFPDAADPLEADLIPSIEDAYPVYNRYTAIKYIMTLTKGFTEAHVLDILQNLMLPHVPEEARPQYLAEMARAAIQANAGQRPKTDRDDMRNQRFLSTGTLVRELFNGCWKDWRAAVILSIDTAYRSNEQLYTGDSIFNLFSESNRVAMFQPNLLNQAIMRGFRGKWGTNERNTKVGVMQPLARISYLDAMSHVRRVVSDFDTGSKITGPRKLHTSQIGYFCTSETPTGAHIGATKNMSMMTLFSLSSPTKPVYDWMRAKGGLIPVSETTAEIRMKAATVQINGGTVGFTLDPVGLTRTLKLLKWTACMSPTASVSFNSSERTVRILLDEGRPIRPLWHLDGQGDAFLDRVPELLESSWRNLVFGRYPKTADAQIRTVRFMDPLPDPAATFADYDTELAGVAGFIEYCDPVEMNEAYISWWGADMTSEHTHAEIHPSTLTGLLASMIPYSNHNQAPRNQLSCSQSKQGIGTMTTNIGNRYDTYSHQLCYGEAPICRTFMYEAIGGGQMPYGFNCVIAATSETGYNQDDGLIINRDSVARGMFQSLAFRAYDCAEEVDKITKVHSHIANPGSVPSWTSLKPGLDYSKLDERGIIKEGTIVDDHTVLVGRYMVLPDTNEIKDASVTPGLFTQGRVDSVVVLHQNAVEGQSRLLVKVRVIEMRIPQIGDKFSSRHGQKGTIGMFVDSADLPRTAEGLVPDVMVNPGGLISRMTVAQLVEMVAGRLGAEVAAKMSATTFCNGGDFVRQLGDVLEAIGASRTGDNVLYSGITGAQVRTDIFMCPLYFMRLKHLTDDKVNARGMGKREVRTHQPTGGRGNEGGLRIGEMERDSLCAHGIATFLQESMMKRGDATTFYICNGCGRIPIYNESEGLFVCPTCDGPLVYNGLTAETMTLQMPTKQSRATFSRIAMPYTLKLLDQEMTGIGNIGFRFVTESSIARLRESDWPWPEIDVEFKAEDRGVGKAERVTLATEGKESKEAGEAGEKPKRKESKASESAGAGGPADSAVIADAMAVRFSNKLANEYSMFATFAPAAFRITGPQIPGADGTAYPELGIAANGSLNAGQQTWPSVEHYYQAMKFPLDAAWQEEIRRAPTPAKAKQMGLSPDHPSRGDWEQIKERVMKTALLEKFRQNPPLLSLLKGTGDRKLEEATASDAYWGVGPKGKGLNRMGVLLTEVRTELKDSRPDTGLLAAVSEEGSESKSDGESESESKEGEANADAAVAGAEDAIAGAMQVVPKQSGGVYLFINPSPAAGVEPRARQARSRMNRNISWEGMSGGGSSVIQEGGGGGNEQMEMGGSATTEVTVEKLG